MDFVNGDEEGTELGDIHQEIGDGKLDILTIASNGAHEGETVGPTERMVASDDGASLERDSLGVDNIEVDVEFGRVVAFKECMDKIKPYFVAVPVDDLVEFGDAEELVGPGEDEAR